MLALVVEPAKKSANGSTPPQSETTKSVTRTTSSVITVERSAGRTISKIRKTKFFVANLPDDAYRKFHVVLRAYFFSAPVGHATRRTRGQRTCLRSLEALEREP